MKKKRELLNKERLPFAFPAVAKSFTTSSCWLTVLILLLSLGCTHVLNAAPSIGATRLTGALNLDGTFDEPDWERAEWQSGFVSADAANEGEPPLKEIQSRFAVLYDDYALYIGVECLEPEPENIKAEYHLHDDRVYLDDSVEIFIDPAGEGRYYHHWIVNTNGVWYDAYVGDEGLSHIRQWDSPLEIGVQVDHPNKVWRAEIRIPFASLMLYDDAQTDWLFNIARERYAGRKQELSTWSPLKGNFHQPALFGEITGLDVDFRRFRFQMSDLDVAIARDSSGNQRLFPEAGVRNNTADTRRIKISAGLFGQPLPEAQWPVATLAPGEEKKFELPHLTVPRGSREAPVQFTVSEADTGEAYKIEVRHLNVEYRPLRAQIIKPNYRNNIYATETVPELVFSVELSQDIAARTEEVIYSLHDEEGQMLREGSSSIDQISDPRKLEVETLGFGSYELLLRAADAEGRTLADYSTEIRKLPPAPGNEVRIDRHRNILINGEPEVFIGWFGSVPLEDPRPDVVALQNVVTPLRLQGADPARLRELYDDHGIYSIVSIIPRHFMYIFEWWREGLTLHEEVKTHSEPSEKFVQYLKRMVEAVKSEPGLFAYYLADEPEIDDIRSDYLEAVYNIMRELDPYHPVIITNRLAEGIETIGYRASDILNPNPYNPSWDYVPGYMRRFHEVTGTDKGLMLTPWHAARQTHFMRVWGTEPPYPYKVMRNQYLVSVAYGCRGFTGYTNAFFLPEPELRYGLPHIWREIRFLEPAMANPGENPEVESEIQMAGWMGEADGHIYMIVVNHSAETASARISHPRLSGVRSLVVASEARTIDVRAGSFTDTFGEGDARIYTTNREGLTLPTTSEVEDEIAQRKAENVKPGNLLHSDLGVRVRATEGYYSPWYHQYYYYAINGITDAGGWILSHTNEPSWIELTLPEARSIGRVVIYSPNIGDYDLRFQSPDGSEHTAEIRGSVEDIAEHNFSPEISAIKIRITARGRRDGAGIRGIAVHEIEAYSKPGEGPSTPLRTSIAGPEVPAYTPPESETAGERVLWRDDFTDFQTAERFLWDGTDDRWVIPPGMAVKEPQPGGGLAFANNNPGAGARMSRIFNYDPEYRYLQVKIGDIEGEGYRWGQVLLHPRPSAEGGYRSPLHTSRPGIYTIDTHYVNDSFKTGGATGCMVSIYTSGTVRNPDGTTNPGPKFTFSYLQLVRRMEDGLIVTLADGSPLPATLKQGDSLLYRVYLKEPAQDVTVEALSGARYNQVPVNGEPYVQLFKTGDGDGREWMAQIRLGTGTGSVSGETQFPVLFRAIIAGGAIPETFQTAAIRIE